MPSSLNFQTWLRAKDTKAVWGMYETRRQVGAEQIYLIDALPKGAADAPPR